LFRLGVSTTLAGTLFGSDLLGMPRASAQGGASTVAIVTHSGLRAAEGDDRRHIYGVMLDKALSALGTAGTRGALWQAFVPPGGGIGIKVNCLGGLGISTDPQFAYAIAEGLIAGGADPTSIIVFDREDAHLENAGYPIVSDGKTIRVYGSNNPVAGYEDRVTRFGDAGDRLSRILTEQVKSVVNAPILKDHGIAGITCALKNHFGVIQNPNKFHANRCEPYVSDLNTLRVIRRTQRICVADCREVLYEGGPGDNANYHYEANSIMVSTDPVALDTVGWQVIEGIRKEKGLQTLQDADRPPRHIAAAADLGLGVADVSSISVVNETIG
jgi:uncharacterized protein (DUF362 family)